jgi:hypothetical protein
MTATAGRATLPTPSDSCTFQAERDRVLRPGLPG